MSISFSDRLSSSMIGAYHNQIKGLSDALPPTGKSVEVVKRIAAVIFAPVAYPILGAASLIGCAIDAARFRLGEVGKKNVGAVGQKQFGAVGQKPGGAVGQKPGGAVGQKPGGAVGQKPGGAVGQKPVGKIAKVEQETVGKAGGELGNYFVRFINVQVNGNRPANVNDLNRAMNEDVEDLNKKYHKGANIYTPNGVQKLALDTRSTSHSISVDLPFAVLINPNKAKLHYWSLGDMDRTGNREDHENALKGGMGKYKPTGWNNGTQGVWRTVHFTGAAAAFKKIETVGKAAMANKDVYVTSGGKEKPIGSVKNIGHNEGAVTYKLDHVEGFLIKNTPADIELAKKFKNEYKDAQGKAVFKDAFLAYQDEKTGKIVRIES